MLAGVDVERLRVEIYRHFATRGQAPTVAALASATGASKVEVRGGLQQLAQARHVALAGDGGVAMAHPFSAVPLGFVVMSDETLWWGGCAWDSFALPHLVGELVPGAAQVLVATRCPACDQPHAWNVDRTGPPVGEQVAHFLIPAARMWDDVMHTCAHQRVFCSEACVQIWLDRTGNVRGYVMDLATLWRLAQHWYDGRMDHGYVRRDPAAAAGYLRSVGLSGPFWGL